MGNNKNKKIKVKKPKVSSKVTNTLPFLDIEEDIILLKDEFMDILEIQGKDIFSLMDSELERDISVIHSFLKVINADIKFVSMNFPVDASRQINYVNYKLSKTKNEVYKSFLKDKRKELEYLQKNRTDKEYYIFVFANNPDNLDSTRNTVLRILKNVLVVRKIPIEKKKLILFKLNNMNLKITAANGGETIV